MRDLTELDSYRLRTPEVLKLYGSYGDATAGVFIIPYLPTNTVLKCIASAGEGWDHVSTSLPYRIPYWSEMQFIHRTFFKPDEIAWEYHIPTSFHINIMPNCLHLWRKHNFKIPTPPTEFV